MAMVVKNNMSAVRTLNTLNKNSSALQKSLAKVSSGMKINSAQDDASGYAISERMRVQIRSLDQANQNTQNASSLMKTAEGAVSSTMEILKSLKEKAINAATDTNTDQDRATIQKELDQFVDQIDDNALTTFNGKYLIDGSKAQRGTDTATTMTNQSLGLYEVDGETELTSGTALTNLTNRNGESLEIRTTDSVTASFVMNGKTYTTTYKVEGTTLGDIFTNLNAVYASDTGVEGAAAFGNGVTSPAANAGGAGGAGEDPAVAAAKKVYDDAVSAAAAAAANIDTTYTAAGTARTTLLTALKASKVTVSGSAYGIKVGSHATSASNAVNSAALPTKGTAATAANLSTTLSSSLSSANATIKSDAQKIVNCDEYAAYTDAITAYNDALTAKSTADTAVTAAKTAYDAAVANAGSGSGGAAPTTGVSADTATGDLVMRDKQVGINAFGDPVYTANGETGLTVTAATPGIQTQISGLSISITDSEGNVKKAANASLDAFKTTIYAKNHSEPNELTFHTGAAANQAITVGLEDMRSEALGLKGSDGSKISLATQEKANAAVSVFDNAIQKVLDHQATIGAIEARLEYTSQNLTTSSENVQAAESTIRDADMAKEMTNYTKNNVLLQAAQSMLAQANQNSSAVLSLLQ